MNAARPLRIALLCHSVNPRGGVVHALELAGALAAAGHEPVVHAPDVEGRGFFRALPFETVVVPATRAEGDDTAAMVARRVEDYLRHFAPPAARRFDVFHAQDGISGNALATLKERGQIGRFARTVHHLDHFSDPRVSTLQLRSVSRADLLFTVSEVWRRRIVSEFGRDPVIVGNGVDLARFRPEPDGAEASLRARFDLGGGPVILSVGGVEERKNTLRILDAFRQIRAIHGEARLLIAGGASLLDHGSYRAAFARDLAASRLPPTAVTITGAIPDAEMPALYRIADVLAFPSLREGFGLVALEALACGVPAAVSRIPPFTEHLGEDEVAWCDPLSAGSIANALMAALAEPLRSRLALRGREVAARFGWDACAQRTLAAYPLVREAAHA